jgi:putative transposase
MPQSIDNVLIHLIFSTKDRHPFLADPVRESMHGLIATITRDCSCICLKVGGPDDHIHCAIRLARTISISTLVEEIKRNSSRWIKNHAANMTDFAWQRGYAVFSVGLDKSDVLVAYIDNQVEHHKKISFKEEYLSFLKKYNVPYDDRYVWD